MSWSATHKRRWHAVHRVVITPEAEGNLREASSYIRRDNPRAARVGLKGLGQRTKHWLSFRTDVTAGNRGTYRILLVVLGETVFILRIRHGAMLPLKPGEL